MRRTSRLDANHSEIVEALKGRGFEVFSFASLGRGVPDLYAARGGSGIWIEVKDGSKPPSERRLTPDQERFHQRMANAGVLVIVVERVEDVASL